MDEIRYEFLDPFMKEEMVKEHLSKEQVLDDFCAIDWYNLIMRQFFGNTNPSSTENVAPKNTFWYFNVSYLNSQQKKIALLVVPNFASRESFSESDLRFSLEYWRPKMIDIPKWKRLFGGVDQKLKNDFNTCIRDINIGEATTLLKSFLNSDLEHLEKKITEAPPLFLNRFD